MPSRPDDVRWFGEDRKYPGHRQIDAIDPKRSYVRVPTAVLAKTRLGFLRDVIAVGLEVQNYRFGNACALISRNPLIVHIRTAIALGIFDKSRMNGICDQYFYRVG